MSKRRNTRYHCKGCGHRNTEIQLRKSLGKCIHCGTLMHHDNWRGHASIGKQLNLSIEEDAEIVEYAASVGIEPSDLMRIAILNRLYYWKNDVTGRLLNNDIMLQKLVRTE